MRAKLAAVAVAIAATASAQYRDYDAYNARVANGVNSVNNQQRAQHEQFVREAKAAERAHAAHVAQAVAASKAAAANPWLADARWHAATNKVGQLQLIVQKNDAELTALKLADKGDSDRYRQVSAWQLKAQATLEATRAEVVAAQADARLRMLNK